MIDSKWMSVSRRMPDGSWKIHRDIYNGNDPAFSPDADLTAIAAVGTQLQTAVREDDVAGIMAGLTANHLTMPPDQPTPPDNEALEAWHQARVDQYSWAGDITTDEVRIYGKIALERWSGTTRVICLTTAPHSLPPLDGTDKTPPPAAGPGPFPPFFRPNDLPSLTSGRPTPLLSTRGTAVAGSGPPYPPENPVVRTTTQAIGWHPCPALSSAPPRDHHATLHRPGAPGDQPRRRRVTYLALANGSDPMGDGVPDHVEKEFRSYLKCGILAHGFARARCSGCGYDFLVAFSCKGRGVCPSFSKDGYPFDDEAIYTEIRTDSKQTRPPRNPPPTTSINHPNSIPSSPSPYPKTTSIRAGAPDLSAFPVPPEARPKFPENLRLRLRPHTTHPS